MTDVLGLNTPADVMMSIADIAAREGVSRPAVSMKVKRLIDQHELQVERDDRGRVARVNVAQYDMLRERHADPSKDQRPASDEDAKPQPADDANSYNEALRQKTWYAAERERLSLEEAFKRLVSVDEVVAAIDAVSDTIASVVRTLQNETDALAGIVARDGSHGLRIALKGIETKMLSEISTALEAVAEGHSKTE